MKIRKAIRITAIILCLSILCSTVANASGNMVKLSQKEISSQSISSDSVSAQAKTVGKKYTVMFFFVFTRSEPSFFGDISGILFIAERVTVLSNSGFYSYVKTDDGTTGYVFSGLLSSGNISRKSLTINPYAYVYVGKTSYTKLKVDYDGTGVVKWKVSDSSIVDFNESTGEITGLKPGVVKITASVGILQSAECIVSVINKWVETEYAVSNKTLTIKQSPGDTYKTTATVPKNTSIVARGDFADGSGWIYISAMNTIEGFIKVSDFPGIDYLMTQYHYYDEGYEKRFGSASTKVYDYASVLNDVMMVNFRLKVCPYVYSYTSAADQCKIWRYGSKYLENLSGSCPKNGNHNTVSCLRTTHIRDMFIEEKDVGTNVLTKAVWTGHIMEGHKASTSEFVSQTLVFTTANTVSYNSGAYSNKSPSNIRYYSLYEITHETGHQLGLVDGYCYKDGDGKQCSNKNCFYCNGKPIPNCIMSKIKSPTNTTDMFCDDCVEIIKSHLKDHH